uniref:Uncharacterized protein n=1 Tax=Aquila chrysaetos chrysaetos TaxID=223781 RepID=A0A663E1Y7_AQUCH
WPPASRLYIPGLQNVWSPHARSPTSRAQHPSFPHPGSLTSQISRILGLNTPGLLHLESQHPRCPTSHVPDMPGLQNSGSPTSRVSASWVSYIPRL